MNISEVHRRFDLFVDKVANPYFSRQERDDYINQAARRYIQQQFRSNAEQAPFEATVQEAENIHELIVGLTLPTDAEGKLTYAAINAAILPVTQYKDGTENGTFTTNRWCRFLTLGRTYTPANPTNSFVVNYGGVDPGSVSPGSGEKVLSKYVRHSDYYLLKTNRLTGFSELKPRHRYFDQYLQFYPAGIRQVEIALVRYPVPINYDIDNPNDATSAPGSAAVDLEFSDTVCDAIIAIAIGLTGISIREEELITGSNLLKND